MKIKSAFNKAIGASVATASSLYASVALAAQDATTNQINQGFYELGQDLQTLLNGSGGFLVIILSVLIGIITWALGRGPGMIFSAVGVTLILGYGVTALTGLSGVTALVDMLPMVEAAAATAPEAVAVAN